ncbi:hypothetical protein K1719_031072 [Acacia pycnantha]|nr:hypothetical protein K1719_031072 [Acacia pycnantha]
MLSHSLSLVLILFLLAFSIDAEANNKLPKGFSVDLIHRDSPLSPFYNSSTTHSERLQNAALRSVARANGFSQSVAETDVFPNGADYLMKISVGTNPTVERLATADTGSDLIWFQCSPCTQCNRQNAPFFDPQSSSTYEALQCNSDYCNALFKYIFPDQYPPCGESSNECVYYYSYADNSSTTGELATETISFGTSDDGNSQGVSFPNTVFGCGYNNNATFGVYDTGLVGLGQGNLSLVSQIGYRKFSYCLPPFSSQKQTTTKLRFGGEATISGNGLVSTPLISSSRSQTYYYLNLEGITIGQKKVSLPTNRSDGNIIIDSGTTLTTLPSSSYDQVEALVKQAIGADQFIVQIENYNLCYSNANSVQQNVPYFEVHFTGADLSLKPQNLFRFLPVNGVDVMCFAMFPTEGQPIYGNVAQIDFEVGYDLDQKNVSFAPVDLSSPPAKSPSLLGPPAPPTGAPGPREDAFSPGPASANDEVDT